MSESVSVSFPDLCAGYQVVKPEHQARVEDMLETWQQIASVMPPVVEVLPELPEQMTRSAAMAMMKEGGKRKQAMLTLVEELAGLGARYHEIPAPVAEQMIEITHQAPVRAAQYLPEPLLERWAREASSEMLSALMTELDASNREKVLRATRGRQNPEQPEGPSRTP